MKTLFQITVLLSIFLIHCLSLPNGAYLIKSEQFNTYWDICGNTKKCSHNPSNIFMNNLVGDSYQVFYINKLRNGYYTISSYFCDEGVAAINSFIPSKSIILTRRDSSRLNQQFAFISNGKNSYVIRPRLSLGKVIEPPFEDNKGIFLNENCGTDLQRFSFELVDPDDLALLQKKYKKKGSGSNINSKNYET